MVQAVDPSAPKTMIECRGISKVYRNVLFKDEITALDKVSFSLEDGEICGLVGPNGAGKSTLIKVILGIEPRMQGEIIVSSESKNIGYVPEKPIFFEDEDAFHNLLYFARLAGLSDPEMKCQESLIEFGLAGREKSLVSTFSKGMKQRLAIARCMLSEPDIIMMDEPFSGLDPTAVIEIRGHLQELSGHGLTVLLSSHELGEIDKVCETIIFIDKGKVIKKVALHSTSPRIRVKISYLNMNGRELDIVKGLGAAVLSNNDLEMMIEIEKEKMPALFRALVSADANILESRIMTKTTEDIYTEVFMGGGAR
ncbi:MAG: putative ABC transporter ATP-binding protein [Methanomassiliicoccales archaeon PtaU1.Bin124]|nr:MAG: putative ABC transporter ATP-binding protein [Methanomassiliicoccales archaeon PtaU1.Bin124]